MLLLPSPPESIEVLYVIVISFPPLFLHLVAENGSGSRILVLMLLMSGTVCDTTSCHSAVLQDPSRESLRSARSLYTLWTRQKDQCST